MAGNVTAFNTVWTYDIYQAYINKKATDAHYLWMGRMATIGGIAAVDRRGLCRHQLQQHHGRAATRLLVRQCTAVRDVPARHVLEAHDRPWRFHRTALRHLRRAASSWPDHPGRRHCLGIHGGWISIVHHYPSDMAQNFWTAIFAFSVNLVVTIAVSLVTKPRAEPELVGLVYSLTPKPVEHHLEWYQKPATLAIAVFVMLIVLNLVFA